MERSDPRAECGRSSERVDLSIGRNEKCEGEKDGIHEGDPMPARDPELRRERCNVPAADEAKTDQVGEGKAEEAIEETNREGRG